MSSRVQLSTQGQRARVADAEAFARRNINRWLNGQSSEQEDWRGRFELLPALAHLTTEFNRAMYFRRVWAVVVDGQPVGSIRVNLSGVMAYSRWNSLNLLEEPSTTDGSGPAGERK